jgi:hypothetical protein
MSGPGANPAALYLSHPPTSPSNYRNGENNDRHQSPNNKRLTG